ncbi:hypothetical protein EG487_20150 [Paenibacillus polymyxa]|nr:hypothetical protein EG487_20150 [Paenibacillus polymyxa]
MNLEVLTGRQFRRVLRSIAQTLQSDTTSQTFSLVSYVRGISGFGNTAEAFRIRGASVVSILFPSISFMLQLIGQDNGGK